MSPAPQSTDSSPLARPGSSRRSIEPANTPTAAPDSRCQTPSSPNDRAGLGFGSPSSNPAAPTHRPAAARYNRALMNESNEFEDGVHESPRRTPIGLGLAVGRDFHISLPRTPTTPGSPLQRTEADGTPITYSFRPPGLSTPIPSIDEDEWLSMPARRTELDFVPPPGTALLRLPSISRQVSLGSESTVVPSRNVTGTLSRCASRYDYLPATPRLQSIDRFFCDPLYV